MAKGSMLEELREIFKDDRLHLAMAIVKQLELAQDKSVLRVKCQVVPDNLLIIAKMSWEAVGPSAGFFQIPSPNDLVIVAYVEGDADQAFVIRRCTSKEDNIPLQAMTGDMVMKALAGKKGQILSDTALLLGRGGTDPTENLVLGQVFKTAYSTHLGIDAVHKHIGNLGYKTAPPDEFQDYLDLQASPVDDELMLSDLSFTEK